MEALNYKDNSKIEDMIFEKITGFSFNDFVDKSDFYLAAKIGLTIGSVDKDMKELGYSFVRETRGSSYGRVYEKDNIVTYLFFYYEEGTDEKGKRKSYLVLECANSYYKDNVSDSRKIKDARNTEFNETLKNAKKAAKRDGYDQCITIDANGDYSILRVSKPEYRKLNSLVDDVPDIERIVAVVKIYWQGGIAQLKVEKANDITTPAQPVSDSRKIKDADETQDVLDGILMIAFNDGSEEEGYNEVKKHANEQGELDGVQYETYDTDNQDGVTLIDLCAATDDANAFVKALLTEWGIIDAVADIEFEKSELMENAEVSDSRKISDRKHYEGDNNNYTEYKNCDYVIEGGARFSTEGEDFQQKTSEATIWVNSNVGKTDFWGNIVIPNLKKKFKKFGYIGYYTWDESSDNVIGVKLVSDNGITDDDVMNVIDEFMLICNQVSDSKVSDMTKPAHLRGYAEKYRKKRREQKESYKENEEETQDKEVSDSKIIKNDKDMRRVKDDADTKVYSVHYSFRDADNWYNWSELNESTNPTYTENLKTFLDKESAEAFYDSYNENDEGEGAVEITLFESDLFDLNEFLLENDYESVDDILDNDGSVLDYAVEQISNFTELYYSDLNSKTIEGGDYNDISPDAVVVVWQWHRYIGYARTFKRIAYASQEGIETEKDLITGNSESTMGDNYSVIVDNADGYTDDELYQVIMEEMGDSSWKWNNNYERYVSEFCGINDIDE